MYGYLQHNARRVRRQRTPGRKDARSRQVVQPAAVIRQRAPDDAQGNFVLLLVVISPQSYPQNGLLFFGEADQPGEEQRSWIVWTSWEGEK